MDGVSRNIVCFLEYILYEAVSGLDNSLTLSARLREGVFSIRSLPTHFL